MADATETTRLAEKVAAIEAKLTKLRERDCNHAGLVVSQDPSDGRKELLVCPACDMEPRKRVSAAASIKEAADAGLAEMRAQIETIFAALSDLRGRDGALAQAHDAIKERLTQLEAAPKPLDPFGGAP